MEYEISTQQKKLTLSPESLFLSHRELKAKLTEHVRLVLNSMKISNSKTRKVHQLQFVENKSLRNQFESAKASSAASYMVQLLQNWKNSGTPVFLSAKNQTHSDGFQQLLDDLGVESTKVENQLTTNMCPWLEWLEEKNDENTYGSIPIFTGHVSSGFRKLDSKGEALF